MNAPANPLKSAVIAFLVSAFVCAACGAAVAAAAVTPGVTVVHAGTLLSDPRKPPLRDHSIVIEAGLIKEIRPGFVHVPGARVVDLRSAFVLPGLIDLHVHLTSNPDPDGHLKVVTASGADLALVAAENARRTLTAGFTTVLDMGTGRRAHEEAIYAVRDAIAGGLVQGPRILAVGSPLSAPGSSRASRFRSDVEAVVGPEATCSGADDCMRSVREQVRRGADVISFYNTGSLLSLPSVPQTFTDAEMSAIVSAAHALGRKAIADGGNTPGNAAGVNNALRAGVDWIDTGTYIDTETHKLLREHRAFYVPHLYAVHAAVGDDPASLETGTMGWLPRPILARLYALKLQPPAAIQAHRNGVRLAFGSDPGVFPHGDNAREFVELVRAVRLTPAEAIATATINAAQALGMENQIGRLEAGHAADLIATSRSPLDDVAALSGIHFVMRAGRVATPTRAAGVAQ